MVAAWSSRFDTGYGYVRFRARGAACAAESFALVRRVLPAEGCPEPAKSVPEEGPGLPGLPGVPPRRGRVRAPGARLLPVMPAKSARGGRR